jgi:hypothetical protein
MPNSGSGITTHADVEDFRRLFSKSSDVDKVLLRSLRRNIRQAAGVAADAVKSGLGSGPLRGNIAAGVSVKVMTGTRAGVTIVASSSKMPAGKEKLVRAWAARNGWRHPVFATGAWAHQIGNPGYFDRPITAKKDSIRRAVEDAMTEAARSLQ